MFNPHQSKTADGVLIVEGLVVYTNEMAVGKVVGDRDGSGQSGMCCNESDHDRAAQMRSGTGIYTDHRIANVIRLTCRCAHDHWFTVETANGTRDMNGERLSTTFHEYRGSVRKAADEITW
jgi:hypothetical protein